MDARVAEYRRQLAEVQAEPPFPGKKRLIRFLRRLIIDALTPTSNVTTSNFQALFTNRTSSRRRRQSRAGTRSTRRRNRNGTR